MNDETSACLQTSWGVVEVAPAQAAISLQIWDSTSKEVSLQGLEYSLGEAVTVLEPLKSNSSDTATETVSALVNHDDSRNMNDLEREHSSSNSKRRISSILGPARGSQKGRFASNR
jgi:hypothetical protein